MGVIRSYIFKRAFGTLGITFVQEYQDVLDFADTNGITIPDETQNIKNDLIVRNLIFEGVWDKLDLFYYFEQPSGLGEFITLNWVDASTFRLSQGTPALEPDFVANSGIKNDASGKYYKTGYSPLTNATNVEQDNVGIFYSLFDIPTSFTTENKIFGVKDATTNADFTHTNNLNGVIELKDFQFQGLEGAVGLSQAEINKHYLISKNIEETSKVQIFINEDYGQTANYRAGSLTSKEIVLLGINNDGVIETSGTTGLKYWALGSEMRYQHNDVFNIMNGSYFNIKIDSPFSEVLDPATLSISNAAYFSIYKSSDFPSITTTKDYFALWSTNHASPPSIGGIWWGEMDDLDFTNFVEVAEIIGGFQDETPDLILIPDGGDGRVLHLLYHSDSSDPANGGLQQTHLLTSSGGVLHNAIWTDEGTVLGVADGAVHTGYAKGFIKGTNDYLMIHGIKGWDGATPWVYGRSTSSDYRTWVRESSDVDVSSFMPYERFLQYNQTSYFFERNGEQFYLVWSSGYANSRSDTAKLELVLADGNYYPVRLIGTVKYFDNGNQTFLNSVHRVGDILNLFMGGNGVLNRTTFDLTKLDNQEQITAITDLTSSEVGFEDITLTFTEPKTTIGNIGYNVYVDGSFNKRVYDFPIFVDGLTNLQTYDFTVKSLNVSGIESLVSNTLNQEINGAEGIPYSSIVSRYTFEDNTDDVVGSNDGINTDVTFVTDFVSKAGVFNNVGTTTIEIPDSNNLTFLGAFSISLLYKATAFSNQWLVSKRDASNHEYQFMIYQSKLQISLNDGSNAISATVSFAPTVGQEYHLGFTYNDNGLNTGIEIYIDGVKQILVRNGTFTGIVNTTAPTYIGGLQLASPLFPMNATVDEVILWGIDLTEDAFLELATEQLAGTDITP